jgi:hypothetical protein
MRSLLAVNKLTAALLDFNVNLTAVMFQSSEREGGWVLGLVKADFAAAWQSHLGQRTPTLFLPLRTCNALLPQCCNFSGNIVTHQVEFVMIVFFSGMNGRFGSRQREDQPAVAGIDIWKIQNVAKESPVRFGVLAVNDDVRA